MPMRQLRSCDFCGGDAAGVYEVLPPELSPTEAEQRRIVLCSDCAGTLETVVDPLLERLGVETGDGASPSNIEDESEGQSVAAEESAADDSDDDFDSDGPDRSPTADPASGSDPDEGPVQWGDSAPTGDDGPDDPESLPSEPVRNGISEIDPSDDADDAVDGAVATGDDDSAPGDEPEEFRTVMRLLGNREFPVERDAIVELAASAYELDEQHVHRIIDHAVDRGVLADDGGTLKRN